MTGVIHEDLQAGGQPSDEASLRLPLTFFRATEAVPRLLTALGQEDNAFYLLAIRPRHLEEGLFAVILRDAVDREENGCEALYGRLLRPGVLDVPGSDATAAQVWDDFYFLHRAAEAELAESDALPGTWTGYFEPQEYPARLVISREIEAGRSVWIVAEADRWEVRLGASPELSDHVTQASGIREAFEQAVRAAGGRPVREALRAPTYRRSWSAGGPPLRRW